MHQILGKECLLKISHRNTAAYIFQMWEALSVLMASDVGLEEKEDIGIKTSNPVPTHTAYERLFQNFGESTGSIGCSSSRFV